MILLLAWKIRRIDHLYDCCKYYIQIVSVYRPSGPVFATRSFNGNHRIAVFPQANGDMVSNEPELDEEKLFKWILDNL